MKHYKSNSEIQEYFLRLVDGEEPNSNFVLAGIYNMAERHIEDDQRTEFINRAFENNMSTYVLERTFICERLSIAKIQMKVSGKVNIYYVAFVDRKKSNVYFYNSFPAALIGGICAMYKSNGAAPYIMRMLGIKESGCEDCRNKLNSAP